MCVRVRTHSSSASRWSSGWQRKEERECDSDSDSEARDEAAVEPRDDTDGVWQRDMTALLTSVIAFATSRQSGEWTQLLLVCRRMRLNVRQ